MSHAIAHFRSPAPRAAAAFAIFAALAALAATVDLSLPVKLAQGSAAVARPAAGGEVSVTSTMAVPSPSISVPDASVVFAGRDAPVEDPVPTF
jgi:hypothetical protein